jgi:uncharacterized protein (TIGR02145 family)
MKQFFFLLATITTLFYSCSTDNTNTTTVVPIAPNGLTATVVSTTQVNLSWTDNSTNESGYKIQRKSAGGNFTDVGSTGADIATFSDQGLTPNTSYTYRVYSYNSAGNSLQYSNEVTIISVIDSPSVTIGSQVWTTKNLDVDRYRNGNLIPQVADITQWANLTTGAWCYYNNDPAMGAIYGKLYNWYAVNDPRGLAPQGWHIPDENEWDALTSFLGGVDVAGGAMKSVTGWSAPNIGATNSSGFNGLGGGLRNYDFAGIGEESGWWSANQFDESSAMLRYLFFEFSSLNKDNSNKKYGRYLRLVKD